MYVSKNVSTIENVHDSLSIIQAHHKKITQIKYYICHVDKRVKYHTIVLLFLNNNVKIDIISSMSLH